MNVLKILTRLPRKLGERAGAWHLAFFFPLTEKDLNWEKVYEFLDKEFQSIVKDLTGL